MCGLGGRRTDLMVAGEEGRHPRGRDCRSQGRNGNDTVMLGAVRKELNGAVQDTVIWTKIKQFLRFIQFTFNCNSHSQGGSITQWLRVQALERDSFSAC